MSEYEGSFSLAVIQCSHLPHVNYNERGLGPRQGDGLRRLDTILGIVVRKIRIMGQILTIGGDIFLTLNIDIHLRFGDFCLLGELVVGHDDIEAT